MFEYKTIIINPSKDDDGKYLPMKAKDIDERLNILGRDGWILRSHTMRLDSTPMVFVFVFGRKLDIVEV